MATIRLRRTGSKVAALLTAAATAVALLTVTTAGSSTDAPPMPASVPAAAASSTHHGAVTVAELKLYLGMRQLWEQHMEWTYSAIAAFAAGTKGLHPTLNRLLQNQTDIGDAIKPFYGEAAGDTLTKLLKAHIDGFVPILVAGKAGDRAAENKAITAELANARAIGDFLAAANPQNWPKKAMERMVELHIGQTLVYATDQLKGNYKGSIREYGKAELHMDRMGNMLAKGIVAQFPEKFGK